MVIPDPAAAAHADQVLFLADGLIADRPPSSSAAAVAVRMAPLTARRTRPHAAAAA
ncbi:hypothetical protein ACWGIU_16560 [Streptomyces sp. NPDC054840]